jgi:hypothetical protein
MRAVLDSLDEVREVTRIWQTFAKISAARRYNIFLVPRAFKVGNLVLRKTDGPRKVVEHGKLVVNWKNLFGFLMKLEKGSRDCKNSEVERSETPRILRICHFSKININ